MATRKTLTLAEKLDVVKSHEEVPSQSQKEIAAKYGVSVATISRILKNRQSLKSTSEKVQNLSRKRQRSSAAPDVDEALFTWFRRASTIQGVPISGDVLKEKALFFARSLNVENFMASDGWLGRWKTRYNVVFRKAQGEKRDADTPAAETWLKETLPNILSRYNESDIFNADETGLYYRLLPDRSHISKGESLAGGKNSKARVTVMVGANMNGTEKLPLLLIGKSRKPRCFRGCKTLPCAYDANANAWMTGKIFEEWIKKWDNKLRKAKRKVVLIIDNCTAHPSDIRLTNIEVIFLPPNVTSIIQPCDQGIIKALKAHYHKAIIKRLVAAIDAGSSKDASEFSKNFDLLDCMNTIVASWSEITAKTIANCFRHAGFVSKPDNEEDLWDEDDNIPLVQLLAAPRGMDQQTFDDIVSADNFLETAPPIDENSIIEEQQSIQESDDEIEPKPVITHAQFISNLADMKDYLCSHGFDDWKSFSSLANFSTEVCSKVAKTQTLIDNYFQ